MSKAFIVPFRGVTSVGTKNQKGSGKAFLHVSLATLSWWTGLPSSPGGHDICVPLGLLLEDLRTQYVRYLFSDPCWVLSNDTIFCLESENSFHLHL